MPKDFYPTPAHLISKMLEGVELDKIDTILEPSAGKGDIVDYIKSLHHYRRTPDIDVIELDSDLQKILTGKEYHLIYDDFLTFKGCKKYDLIIANFPFSDGDVHLQKALSILSQYGGGLVCLVNAETIKNPFSNLRKIIATRLKECDATIEFIENAFVDAERKTGVEVALIRVLVEKENKDSIIIDNLTKAESIVSPDTFDSALIDSNPLQALISRFDIESKIGLKLIAEYHSLSRYMLNRLEKKGEEDMYNDPILKLEVGHAHSRSNSCENDYLRALRLKYWRALVSGDFGKRYTSNIQKELNDKLNKLADYDFNLFNIKKLEEELSGKILTGIEKSILDLFDDFTGRYHYSQDLNKNIHYYNGWKSNKAHKINQKIVLPINGFSSYSFSRDKIDDYYIREKVLDMVKVFNYLSSEKIEAGGVVGSAIQIANNSMKFRDLDFAYFTATFYKKGTCHITFTDKKLLDKFNIFGSQRKGWLPPSYGKKSYTDMNAEERSVVDDFQGREEYEKVLLNKSDYLVEDNKLLLEGPELI